MPTPQVEGPATSSEKAGMDDTTSLFEGRNTRVSKKHIPTWGVFQVNETGIVDVVVVYSTGPRGVGEGEGWA